MKTPGLYSGLEEIVVSDPHSRTTFPMLVIYPTETTPVPTHLGPYTLNVAVKAPLKAGHFPLVVISHGSGSSYQVFRNLALHLSQNGFIVCMPEHPFNNRHNNDSSGTLENLTDRPRHISAAIDFMFSEKKWQSHLHKDQVAGIGHSLGGYTVLALAGGVPHTQHQIKFDPNTKITSSQEIQVKADPRLKALVLLAPATAWFASEGALHHVKVPVLIFSGEKDTITPAFHSEIVVKGMADPAQVTHRVVKNGDHFSFLSPFPESMKKPGFPPAFDPEGFDREKFHAEMNREILIFLRKTFAGKQA